jgi:hypothetical protein
MNELKRVRFWHLMVGTGFVLLGIGLALIFLPPGVAESGPFEIEFFEARIEGSEMGLALIVLGLSCFLIGRKDLADLRTHQGLQQELNQTGTLAARLVAGQVTRTFDQLPVQPTQLQELPELDLASTRRELRLLQDGAAARQPLASSIAQAQRGLDLLEALEREGYSI